MPNYHDSSRKDLDLEAWGKESTISQWIKEGANSERVDWVDDFGQLLAEEKMTATSLRNFFSEVRNIQARGFLKSAQRFQLLRPKLAYTSAKLLKSEHTVKEHKNRENRESNRKGLHKFVVVMAAAHRAVDPSQPIQFDHYVELMEAIVAYHKLYSAAKESNNQH